MTIEEIKEAYQEFKAEMEDWIISNEIIPLRDYKEYHDAQVWGKDYKKAQHHFEKISSLKNVVFGVISLTEQVKESGDRIVKAHGDNLIKLLDTDLRRLDNLLFTSRERLKFYENIMRVMGNITWGSY